MTVMPAFIKFHNEAAIIGRIVTGYGELEFSLCHCVAMARDDLDAVFKSLFRARGEKQRILIADALGRSPYRELGFETRFSDAIGAMKFCLTIRNQYAHCNWSDDNSGKLAFVNLEEIAVENAEIQDYDNLTTHYVDVPLLQKQEAFFVHTHTCLSFLNYEGRYKRGKLKGKNFLKYPAKTKRPLLYIPQ